MEIKQITIWTLKKDDGSRFGQGPWPTTREEGERRLADAQRSALAFAERARRPVVTLTLCEETAWAIGHVQYDSREDAEAAKGKPSAFTSAAPDPRGANRAGETGFAAWGRRFD